MIDIVDDTNPYPVLPGIHWEIENQTIINFNKRILSFKYFEIRVVAHIDPLEGKHYVKHVHIKGK